MKDKVIFSMLMASLMQLMSYREEDITACRFGGEKDVAAVLVPYKGRAPITDVVREINFMIGEWDECRGKIAVAPNIDSSEVVFAAYDPKVLIRVMALLKEDIKETQRAKLSAQGNTIGLS